jgi:hypothetical protein
MGNVLEKCAKVGPDIDMGGVARAGASAVKKSAVQIEYEETSFGGRNGCECRDVHTLVGRGIDELLDSHQSMASWMKIFQRLTSWFSSLNAAILVNYTQCGQFRAVSAQCTQNSDSRSS